LIDGWLNIDIKGFGVENVSYSSLSGGERKSIDMALQFACNDLASLQARSILNVRIYDEILDSSLDTQSLYPLLNIMRVKQQKMDSSIYVITHRNDITDLEFDNYINIEKTNGFSQIKGM
jgi:DNA repair exonuclease SbcCD ATPase subunit